ncbi:murein DD-endopeptidase MepM/ murein hydrolase activator NlpD [Lysobacter sp. HA18]
MRLRSGLGVSRRLRRWLASIATLVLVAVIARWAWYRPFMDVPRTLVELHWAPVPTHLPVPVQGVAARGIADTWAAPRGRDRHHEGVDIFAKRGTTVTSTTRGLVVAIRDQGLGGRQVWVLGPAGERHYYAHLDGWAPGLKEGDVVMPGTALGIVGDTGNARGTPPHLHYGIYTARGAVDPWPRLRAGASARNP